MRLGKDSPVPQRLGVLMVLAMVLGCDVTVTPPAEMATIGVSPRNVLMRSFARNPDAVSETVDVFNNGEFGSLQGIQATITSGNASGWLTVGGFADGKIPLEASAAALVEGTYTATVELTLSSATNSPRTFTVEFVVGEGPVLTFTSDTVQFHNTPNDAGDRFTKTMAIANRGGGRLSRLSIGTITYHPDDPLKDWLAVTVTENADSVILEFVATYVNRTDCRPFPRPLSRLADRLCSAEVPVLSTVAANSPQVVTVLLTFDNEPTVFLSPKGVNFVAAEGGASPSSQDVELSATGVLDDPPLTSYQLGAPLDALGNTVDWLSTSVVDSTVTLTADPTGLLQGSYEAGVEVTHPQVLSRGSLVDVQPDTIRVTLTVEPPPRVPPFIIVSSDNVSVSTTTTATITITNGGDDVLTGLTVSSDVAWLLAFLDSNSATSTIPATLSVSAHPTNTPPAGSTGQLTIEADGAAPVTVQVTFTG
jgi:hypothetical protein